ATGARTDPLGFKAALSSSGPAEPGDTVWLKAGTYRGTFTVAKAGRKGRPIIYRAVPGERVTILGKIRLHRAYVWLWGLEVTAAPARRPREDEPEHWHKTGKDIGDAVHIHGRDTDGVKVINMVIHDLPGTAVGGWDVGDDHEYYGNIIYRNGVPGRTRGHYHGFYTQNTRDHTTKRIVDNILFDGWSLGLQAYGQGRSQYGFHVEGNISFCNGILSHVAPSQNNLLVGGYKPCGNVTLRRNCTYAPKAPKGKRPKRSTDVGYIAKGNEDVTLEDNWFVGGHPAVHVVNFRKAVVRNNRFYSPHGYVHFIVQDGQDLSKYDWDGNTYYQCQTPKPFTTNTNAYRWPERESSRRYTFAEWKAKFGLDRGSKLVPSSAGVPEDTWLFKRVNRYEPQRVHLAVYNWPRTPGAELDLSYDGKGVRVPMAGRWAPEFAAYILLRE
ncbi:MAG: right-handed parallel beta-helix repeat-containing protein, partial [Planctomycetota bacterium]